MFNQAFINRIDQNRWTRRVTILATILLVISFILAGLVDVHLLHSNEFLKSLENGLVIFGTILLAPKILIFMWRVNHVDDDLIPQGEPESAKVLTLKRYDPVSIMNMLSDKDKSRFLRQPGMLDELEKWSNWYEVSFNDNGLLSQGVLKRPIRIDDTLSELQTKYQVCKDGRGRVKNIVLEVTGPSHLLADILSKPVSNG